MTKHFSQVTSVLALAVGAAVMMTCTATHYSAAEGERATNGTAAKAPAASAQAAPVNREALPFYNAKLPLDQRVDDLIKRLTVVEKAGLMCMASPAIPRLGISQYHWWNEALHGVARNGTATVFPQAIGMAATWDTDLHLKMAQTIATESRAKHNETLHTARQGAQYTGLDQWSPNINIFRDPRWGRGQETYGEDPYLTGRFGISFVKGLQGDDPKYFENIATPKHYAVHSGPEPERHRVNVEPTEQDLYTTYLPAFEATVREAHAYSVMASYNSVDGLPSSANPRLLTDILRKDWGFQGYVVSDVDAVRDVYASHQIAPSPEMAAAMCVKAGCDLNGGTTYRQLADAVRLGYITEAEMDVSLRRLLVARFRMGEFDPPGTDPYANIPPTANDTPEHSALALKVARESMVLLKNANNTLPLKKDLKTVAVIGPTADTLIAIYGNYNGVSSHPITIAQGIRNALPNARVLFTPGSPVVTEDVPLAEAVPDSVLFTDATLKTHGVLGNYWRTPAASDRAMRARHETNINLQFPEQASRDTLPYADGFYAKWTGMLVPPQTGDYQIGFSGKDAYRLYIDGQMVVDQYYALGKRSGGNAIHLEKGKAYNLMAEFLHPQFAAPATPGAPATNVLQPVPLAGPNAPAVLPSFTGALPASASDEVSLQLRWTRPLADGLPAGADGLNLYTTALEAAKSADAVVLVLGITAELEREERGVHFVGFSGGDRTSLDLPLVQERMMQQVVAAAGNKPVALVLTSGSALSVNWANDHVPAIVQAWYPGQHGDAVADVLFGNYNPAGRLPVTFYKSVDDLPPFGDYSMANRTYRYFTGQPLYPFGHGLSYSTFAYSGLAVAPPAANGDVTVSVAVKNTSALAGDEVVQCYVNRDVPAKFTSETDPAALAAASLPRKTLVGFLRVPLQPNEQKTVRFTVTAYQLATVDAQGRHVSTPGNATIQVGGSSAGGTTAALAIPGSAAAPAYKFVAPTAQ